MPRRTRTSHARDEGRGNGVCGRDAVLGGREGDGGGAAAPMA